MKINWWKYSKTLWLLRFLEIVLFPFMAWQFYYIFSKFTITRCSPDKLFTSPAFYHINKISPQESKISSTSWCNPSLQKTCLKQAEDHLPETHMCKHTHARVHTHSLTPLTHMTWARIPLVTGPAGASNFRTQTAAFTGQASNKGIPAIFKREGKQKTGELLEITAQPLRTPLKTTWKATPVTEDTKQQPTEYQL